MDCASLPSFYLSAPTSPGQLIGSALFGHESGADKTDNDEFEFEFETGWNQEDHKYRIPARANSCSTISFADELFCTSQVLPLKPPPRLQTSVPTPPRSFSSRVRNRFAKPFTWNDGSDPFMIALEKVSEEAEGIPSVHTRFRSYSPFSAGSGSSRVNCAIDSDQDEEKEPNVTRMMERKGSMYSRWVRTQTMVVKRSEWSIQQNPTALTMIKRLCMGRNKPNEPTSRESKMQKIKSVLLRYASLKKETNESKQISYFKRLSHSFKTNPKKKESTEPKIRLKS